MSSDNKPAGCLAAIFGIFRRPATVNESVRAGSPLPTDLPYLRKDWLFSQAERSFFGVLEQAVGGIDGRLRIFAKVRLVDVLRIAKGTAKGGGNSYRAHFNRISNKHVDFVICSHDDIRPLLAIELDDSSHQREDRQERDGFLDAACKAAGLPLLRLPCKAGYNVSEIAAKVRAAIGQQSP